MTEDGIAEAFIEFAKKEKLSFFEPSLSVNSFDAEKYERLMDRLEAATIKFGDLERTLRIDSEFFRKKYLAIANTLNKKNLKAITDVVHVFDGNHMKISDSFTDSGIPYYRGQDIHNFFIEQSSPIFIDKNTFNLPYMKRSHLKQGDVLLSIVGTIGKISLVSTDSDATCNCKLAILRSKQIQPEFFAAYLNSEFGQNQIKRFTRGAVQMGLILEDMNQLVIPELSQTIKDRVTLIIQYAEKALKDSELTYQQVEELLLLELGLKDWQPTEENIAVKSFTESFAKSDRLDAEHYQPKYDEFYQRLLKAAKSKNWTIKQYKDLSSKFKYGTSFPLHYLDTGVPFLRIADLQKYRFDQENLKYISAQAAQGQTAKVNTGDVLISRSGTLGLAIEIPEELNGAIFGSYFILTKPNQSILHPTYLAFYINSLIGKIQTEQANTGAIQTNLTIPVLENLKIVCPDLEVQQNFVDLVNQSYAAEDKSKQLLEIAKTGVEKAIEENEERATAWINKQLEKLNINILTSLKENESN